MNDWWNDPPDEPDVPGCPECDIDLEVKGNQLVCPECGYRVAYVQEHYSDAEIEKSQGLIEEVCGEEFLAEKCPHENEWGECDRCDFEGDLAFDAARERRMK